MFGFMCVNDSCIGIKYGFTNPMDSSDKIGILKIHKNLSSKLPTCFNTLFRKNIKQPERFGQFQILSYPIKCISYLLLRLIVHDLGKSLLAKISKGVGSSLHSLWGVPFGYIILGITAPTSECFP